MSSGKKRREEHEEHENHERWLVTYADMVTLLMVLFIVMFAMSQVDQKKFNALKSGLAAGFGQSTSLMDGSESILDQPGTAVSAPIAPNKFAVEVPEVRASAASQAIAAHENLQRKMQRGDAEEEVDRLARILERLKAALAANGLAEDIEATIDERGLVVSLVSKHVVFEPNLATLSARGRLVVDTLAPVLAAIPDNLEIDGHTNQVKVKPKFFPTDWELSSARAVTVLRRLNEFHRISTDRLTASAFGHTKPLVDPSEAGSQAINKRVDIVVLTALPSETRALIKDVVNERAPRRGPPDVEASASRSTRTSTTPTTPTTPAQGGPLP